MELIYADEELNEIGEIPCYIKFDAQIGLSTENQDNDFELSMHENVWAELGIQCGYYIYAPDTCWGGRVDKLVHSVSDERVRIYGTCWRGLLERFGVVPESGDTHVVIAETEANDMLARLLKNAPSHIVVSAEDSGITCSGSIRYKSVLSAAETLLSQQNARLNVSFDSGMITVGAEPVADHSGEIEFSQEYDSSLVSTKQGEMFNHIIALGQGRLEERDIVELWRLPSGTITNDGTAADIPSAEKLSTYIYDYSGVESSSALEEATRRKLAELGEIKRLEISIGSSDVCLELGDRAGARDLLTGMTASLTVTAIRLVVEENSVLLTHTLS